MKDEHPEALLVLAGEPWGKERGLAKRVEDRQVRLELRYLPEGERSLWLDACDAVVCPYRDATGSGVAADAISHGRPVIGTRVDGLVDVIEEGETGLLVPAEDAPALADALRRFIREDLGSRLSANVVARRGRFAPEDHARRILKLGGIPCGA
jgi:glycosyltransferase involved in cell wall biosynthesis